MMDQYQADISKIFEGYKLAWQAKAESEIVCLLLKDIQAKHIKADKDSLLGKTTLSFESVCTKISNAAQHEYPLKPKNILVIKALELSCRNSLKSEKTNTQKKHRKKLWRHFIGSNGKPVTYKWGGVDVSDMKHYYHDLF